MQSSAAGGVQGLIIRREVAPSDRMAPIARYDGAKARPFQIFIDEELAAGAVAGDELNPCRFLRDAAPIILSFLLF